MAHRNFNEEEDTRGGINLQEREDTEFLQKITDMLLEAGYFRARLNNIEPFDKILGGCCWCITGLMYSIEMDFRDDLTLGEKIKLSEKVSEALEQMKCPFQLYPHELQGLNFEKIVPCIGWLIERLVKTRDTRKALTKKQALQSFSRRFDKKVGREKHQHIEKMYELVEKTRPRRAFKSSNIQDVRLEDPKRVHLCLREFNDLSASLLYKQITENIAKLVKYEERERLKNETEAGLGGVEEVKNDGTKSEGISKTIGQIKRDRDALLLDDKNEFLDLNDAILSGGYEGLEKGELDEQISMLRQKTIRVKASDVNQILTKKIDQLTEDVHNFQQQSEETLQQEEEFFLRNEQENHERNLNAIKKRRENLEKELDDHKMTIQTRNVELETVQKELESNTTLQNKLSKDISSLDVKIKESPITEADLEKVHRKEKLKQDIKELKKKCKEEKKKLDEELERIKKKNEELLKEEQAQYLKVIEEKYNQEYEKLMERKKKIAEQNRYITALQRKIENCPSKIELSQYHKRFTELYESINDKFEENRRYVSLFNTKEEVKSLLQHQYNYMDEIKREFLNSKGKKEKELLLENLRKIVSELRIRIETSNKALEELRNTK